MRLSLLSLLLLTTATGAAAQSVNEEPTPVQADAPPPPPPPLSPRSEPPPAPARMERPERQFGDADRGPRPSMAVRDEPQFREVEVIPQAPRPDRQERAERFEPRPAARDPIRSVASAAVDPPRGWEPPSEVSSAPRRPNGAAGTGWRGGNGERRGRVRDVPPAAGSPVFGSAVPSPVTVTQPPRDVSPRSVASGNLRDRIAAEGLRRDRQQRDDWRNDWRRDHRYDWRRYRDRDRARFHLGIYIDPFGFRYHDYQIGWRLPSRYYQARYWINDPYSYRLPPLGGPYRWIRYHDDVLLVDVRDGRVLDIIRDFFW